MFLPDKFARAHFEKKSFAEAKQSNKVQIVIYAGLFALALAVVLRVLPWMVLVGVTVAVVAVMDFKILHRADYVLLLTFVGFFIFTGNIGRIPQIHHELEKMIAGREFLTAVVVSQGISNVPATLLLADFAKDAQELLRGVNVGGLGTLIASMASLISYKAYANEYADRKGYYMVRFTALNLIFLMGMLGLHALSNL
jgi:type IV secretory pathway TrbD component